MVSKQKDEMEKTDGATYAEENSSSEQSRQLFVKCGNRNQTL